MSDKGLITRKFTVSSQDLGEAATLTFVFDVIGRDADTLKPYKDICPVIWKVIPFSSTGNNAYPFEYSNKFSFVRPSFLQWHFPSPITGPGNGVPDVWTAVHPGQQIVLEQDLDGALQMTLSAKAASSSDRMALVNQSGWKEDIVLGIPERGKSIPRYIRVFPDIGDQSTIQVKFTPIVQAYVTKQYSEEDVLTCPMSGTPIWTQNLNSLRAETEWRLVFVSEKNTFKLQQIA